MGGDGERMGGMDGVGVGGVEERMGGRGEMEGGKSDEEGGGWEEEVFDGEEGGDEVK